MELPRYRVTAQREDKADPQFTEFAVALRDRFGLTHISVEMIVVKWSLYSQEHFAGWLCESKQGVEHVFGVTLEEIPQSKSPHPSDRCATCGCKYGAHWESRPNNRTGCSVPHLVDLECYKFERRSSSFKIQETASVTLKCPNCGLTQHQILRVEEPK